jgi:tyrosyl-tRNA synthetase
MSKPRLYSGMQPSADSLQIGNYIGALMQWRDLQEAYDAVFSVVDLHALTQPNDPAELREKTRPHRRAVHRGRHRAVEVDAVRAVARSPRTPSSPGSSPRSPASARPGA